MFLPVASFIHGQTHWKKAERSKQHTLWPFSLPSTGEFVARERMLSSTLPLLSIRLHPALLYSWRRFRRVAVAAMLFALVSLRRTFVLLLLRNISPETRTIFSWYNQMPKKKKEKRVAATPTIIPFPCYQQVACTVTSCLPLFFSL